MHIKKLEVSLYRLLVCSDTRLSRKVSVFPTIKSIAETSAAIAQWPRMSND